MIELAVLCRRHSSLNGKQVSGEPLDANGGEKKSRQSSEPRHPERAATGDGDGARSVAEVESGGGGDGAGRTTASGGGGRWVHVPG